MTEAEENFEEALTLLEDVWTQFSILNPDGTRWAGGLSVLEDVKGFIDYFKSP